MTKTEKTLLNEITKKGGYAIRENNEQGKETKLYTFAQRLEEKGLIRFETAFDLFGRPESNVVIAVAN